MSPDKEPYKMNIFDWYIIAISVVIIAFLSVQDLVL